MPRNRFGSPASSRFGGRFGSPSAPKMPKLPGGPSSQPKTPNPATTDYRERAFAYRQQRDQQRDQTSEQQRGFKTYDEARKMYDWRQKHLDEEMKYRGNYGVPKEEIASELRQGPSMRQTTIKVPVRVPPGQPRPGLTINRPDGTKDFTPQKDQTVDAWQTGYSDPTQQYIEDTRRMQDRREGIPSPEQMDLNNRRLNVQQGRLNVSDDQARTKKYGDYYKRLQKQYEMANIDAMIEPNNFDKQAQAELLKNQMKKVEKYITPQLPDDFNQPPKPSYNAPSVTPAPGSSDIGPTSPRRVNLGNGGGFDFDKMERDLRDKGATDDEINQVRQSYSPR